MSPIVQHARCRSRVAPYIPSYLEEGQKCVVCGDDATGLHYKAITCEGCKGFFRRVCQRGLQFTCKEKENCEINKNTRNVCQRCRLLKCFANGMSAELVLNEVERSAKRELIERNRERKELERIRARIRGGQRNNGSFSMQIDEQQAEMIHRLTVAWCNEIDAPLRMDADFEHESKTQQFAILLRELLRRTFSFANAVPFFSELELSEQECLLVKNRAWLEIQLLRLAHQIDLTDRSLIAHRPAIQPLLHSSPTSPLNANLSSLSLLSSFSSSMSLSDSSPISSGIFSSPQSLSSSDSGISLPSVSTSPSGLRLTDLNINCDALLRDLLTLADSFQKLELDNEQMAVLSAIFIFQSEFLPESSKVAQLNADLWALLEKLIERNSAGVETPQRVGAFPRLHAKVAQLCAVARRHFAVFFEPANAREFARLFA